MAKQKINMTENKRNEVAELPFWEGHLIRIKEKYDDNPSEENRIWLDNVQHRVNRLRGLSQDDSKPQIEKPKFK